jgi:hypothetical protein
MSTEIIDSKLVALQLDNRQFEQAAAQSSKTAVGLDRSLSDMGKDGGKRLREVADEARKAGHDVSGLAKQFSILETVAVGGLLKIGSTIATKLTSVIKKFTFQPLIDGLGEYETKLKSIQTFKTNTGETVDQISKSLSELNAYADRTVYAFGQMTDAASKFTTKGFSSAQAATIAKGIANISAGAGLANAEMQRVLYQSSQINEYMKLMDWMSWERAGASSQQVMQAFIDTAKELNVANVPKTIGAFRDSLKDGWLTTEVFQKTMAKAADENNAWGASLTKAATQVRTFKQLMTTTLEALGSGWAETFELLIGNFDEATEMWTKVGNVVNDIVQYVSDMRNGTLRTFNELGGRAAVVEGLTAMFQGLANVVKPLGAAIQQLIPEDLATKLYNVSIGFRDMMESFVRFTETNERFKALVKNISFALYLFGGLVKAVAGFAKKTVVLLVKGILSAIRVLFTIGAVVSEFIRVLLNTAPIQAFVKMVATGIDFVRKAFDSFKASWGTVENIVYKGLLVLIVGFGKLWEVIKASPVGTLIEWLSNGLINAFTRITALMGPFVNGSKDVREELSKLWESIKMSEGGQAFVAALQSFGKAVKDLWLAIRGSGISEAFKELWSALFPKSGQDFRLLDVLSRVLVGFAKAIEWVGARIQAAAKAIQASALTGTLSKVVDGISVVASNVKNFLANAGGNIWDAVLMSFQPGHTIDNIKNWIGKTVRNIWDSIKVFMTNLPEKLAAWGGEVLRWFKIAGQRLIAAGQFLLAHAEQFGQLMGGLAKIIASLGAYRFGSAFKTLADAFKAKQNVEALEAIRSIAWALVAVMGAVIILGEIPIKKSLQGIALATLALGAMVGAIAALMVVSKKSGGVTGMKGLFGLGVSLLMFIGVIKSFVTALSTVRDMVEDDARSTWAALGVLGGLVAAMLLFVGGAVYLSKQADALAMKRIRTTLIAVGAVISIVGVVVAEIASAGSVGQIVSAGASLVAITLMLTGVMALITKLEHVKFNWKAIAVFAGIGVMMFALGLVLALIVKASRDDKAAITGAVSLGALVAELVLLVGILNKMRPPKSGLTVISAIGTILAISVAMIPLGASLALVGRYNPAAILAGAAAIGALAFAATTITVVIGKIPIKNMGSAFLAIVAMGLIVAEMAALGAILGLLVRSVENPKYIIDAAIGLGATVLALAAVTGILSAIRNSAKAIVSAVALGVVATSLIPIAISVAILAAYNWGQMSDGLAAMGITIGGLIGTVALLGALTKTGTGALIAIAGMVSLIALAGTLVLVAVAFKSAADRIVGVDWDAFMDSLGWMGLAILAVAGVVTALGALHILTGGITAAGQLVGTAALLAIVGTLEIVAIGFESIMKHIERMSRTIARIGMMKDRILEGITTIGQILTSLRELSAWDALVAGWDLMFVGRLAKTFDVKQFIDMCKRLTTLSAYGPRAELGAQSVQDILDALSKIKSGKAWISTVFLVTPTLGKKLETLVTLAQDFAHIGLYAKQAIVGAESISKIFDALEFNVTWKQVFNIWQAHFSMMGSVVRDVRQLASLVDIDIDAVVAKVGRIGEIFDALQFNVSVADVVNSWQSSMSTIGAVVKDIMQLSELQNLDMQKIIDNVSRTGEIFDALQFNVSIADVVNSWQAGLTFLGSVTKDLEQLSTIGNMDFDAIIKNAKRIGEVYQAVREGLSGETLETGILTSLSTWSASFTAFGSIQKDFEQLTKIGSVSSSALVGARSIAPVYQALASPDGGLWSSISDGIGSAIQTWNKVFTNVGAVIKDFKGLNTIGGLSTSALSAAKAIGPVYQALASPGWGGIKDGLVAAFQTWTSKLIDLGNLEEDFTILAKIGKQVPDVKIAVDAMKNFNAWVKDAVSAANDLAKGNALDYDTTWFDRAKSLGPKLKDIANMSGDVTKAKATVTSLAGIHKQISGIKTVDTKFDFSWAEIDTTAKAALKTLGDLQIDVAKAAATINVLATTIVDKLLPNKAKVKASMTTISDAMKSHQSTLVASAQTLGTAMGKSAGTAFSNAFAASFRNPNVLFNGANTGGGSTSAQSEDLGEASAFADTGSGGAGSFQKATSNFFRKLGLDGAADFVDGFDSGLDMNAIIEKIEAGVTSGDLTANEAAEAKNQILKQQAASTSAAASATRELTDQEQEYKSALEERLKTLKEIEPYLGAKQLAQNKAAQQQTEQQLKRITVAAARSWKELDSLRKTETAVMEGRLEDLRTDSSKWDEWYQTQRDAFRESGSLAQIEQLDREKALREEALRQVEAESRAELEIKFSQWEKEKTGMKDQAKAHQAMVDEQKQTLRDFAKYAKEMNAAVSIQQGVSDRSLQDYQEAVTALDDFYENKRKWIATFAAEEKKIELDKEAAIRKIALKNIEAAHAAQMKAYEDEYRAALKARDAGTATTAQKAMIVEVDGQIAAQEAAIKAQQDFQQKLNGTQLAGNTILEFAQVGVDGFSNLANDCATAFNSVFEAITLQGWNNVLSNFAKMGTDMMSSMSGLANAAVPLANLISPQFGAGFSMFAGFLGPIVQMGGQMLSTMAGIADQIIKKIYDTIMDFVNGLWSRRKEIGKSLQKTWNGVMKGIDWGARMQDNAMWSSTQKTFNDIMSLFGWDLRMGIDGAFSSAADQAARSMRGKALDIAYSMVDGVVTGLHKKKGALADASAWEGITQGLFGKTGVITIVGEELIKALMPDGILEELALWAWGSIMHVFTMRPEEILAAVNAAGNWLIDVFIPQSGFSDRLQEIWNQLTGPDGFFSWVLSPEAWPRMNAMWDTLLNAIFPEEWPGFAEWAGRTIGAIAGALLSWPLGLFGDMTGIFQKMFSEGKINWSYVFSWQFFTDFWNAFITGIGSFFSSMWDGFWDMVGDVTGWWTDDLDATLHLDTRERLIGTAFDWSSGESAYADSDLFGGSGAWGGPSNPFAGIADAIAKQIQKSQGLSYSVSGGQSAMGDGQTVIFQQYNQSPQALDEAALYRQTTSLLRSKYES